jgi:hypothetical protein
MTIQSVNDREWFTLVWVGPLFLILLVAVYAIANGGLAEPASAITSPAVAR